jgi:hypothetical protein
MADQSWSSTSYGTFTFSSTGAFANITTARSGGDRFFFDLATNLYAGTYWTYVGSCNGTTVVTDGSFNWADPSAGLLSRGATGTAHSWVMLKYEDPDANTVGLGDYRDINGTIVKRPLYLLIDLTATTTGAAAITIGFEPSASSTWTTTTAPTFTGPTIAFANTTSAFTFTFPTAPATATGTDYYGIAGDGSFWYVFAENNNDATATTPAWPRGLFFIAHLADAANGDEFPIVAFIAPTGTTNAATQAIPMRTNSNAVTAGPAINNLSYGAADSTNSLKMLSKDGSRSVISVVLNPQWWSTASFTSASNLALAFLSDYSETNTGVPDYFAAYIYNTQQGFESLRGRLPDFYVTKFLTSLAADGYTASLQIFPDALHQVNPSTATPYLVGSLSLP